MSSEIKLWFGWIIKFHWNLMIPNPMDRAFRGQTELVKRVRYQLDRCVATFHSLNAVHLFKNAKRHEMAMFNTIDQTWGLTDKRLK